MRRTSIILLAMVMMATLLLAGSAIAKKKSASIVGDDQSILYSCNYDASGSQCTSSNKNPSPCLLNGVPEDEATCNEKKNRALEAANRTQADALSTKDALLNRYLP